MSLISQLLPGTRIQVFYKDHKFREVCQSLIYVGMIEGECLLIRWPSKHLPPMPMVELDPGVILKLKSVINGDSLKAINFTAESLGIRTLKDPMLLVSYPTQIQSQTLRHTPRLAVELMAIIKYIEQEKSHLALISDFSLSGLKYEYMPDDLELTLLEEFGESKLVGQTIEITFCIEDDLGEDLTIHGKIKNAHVRDKLEIGIQFLTDDETMIKSIFAILLMRLHGM